MSEFDHYFKPIAYSPRKCRFCMVEYNYYNLEKRAFHELGKCKKGWLTDE
jgi:hypothetical protein